MASTLSYLNGIFTIKFQHILLVSSHITTTVFLIQLHIAVAIKFPLNFMQVLS